MTDERIATASALIIGATAVRFVRVRVSFRGNDSRAARAFERRTITERACWIEPTGQVLGATVTGVDLSRSLDTRTSRPSSGARTHRRAALPRPVARRARAARLLEALRRHPGLGDRQVRGPGLARGRHPLQHRRERRADRYRRRRPGLAHRHVVQRDSASRTCCTRSRCRGATASRSARRVREHARGLRRARRRR